MPQSPVLIRGRIVSGAREAARFTHLPWVLDQVRERLGFEPYPGTLNLRIESPADRAALRRLRSLPGVPLEPQPGFCAARCYPVLASGTITAAVVVPDVPHYPPDVLELLAPVCLRDALDLSDGSPLAVTLLGL